MKNYTITVNGNVYDVTVEENTNGAPAAAREHQHRLRLRQQNRQLQAQQEAFPLLQVQQVK